MPPMQEQFGRYILQERIAIGGMAEIFKARAPGLGGFEKILAIKRLHPRYSQDADFIEMLIDEAKITVELTHSNIGQIFDLGKHDDHYYIAMEFIDGPDLYRIMKRTRERRMFMPVEAAAYVAMEACAGLDYAHRKRDAHGRRLNIIHRDISPQNVLLSVEGEVKIVDFGIAKAALRAYETEAGIIKGKFYYMSPEQAKGEPLDHRTDVFSLGIVMYEMLTGDLLYKDDDDITLLSRVRRAEIVPPSNLRPEVPPMLEQIVMRSLARDREDRYPSARHFQKDLANFLRASAQPFGKAQLRRLVRDLLNNPGDGSLDESMAMDRSEFGEDRASVISEGHLPAADPFSPFTDDPTEMQPEEMETMGLPPVEDVPPPVSSHPPHMESELMELDSGELMLVEDDDDEEPTINVEGATREAYDSIDISGFKAQGGALPDGFMAEEEATAHFEGRHPPTATEPENFGPLKSPQLAPVPTPAPIRAPEGLRSPKPVAFAAEPTPTPSPAPAEARPQRRGPQVAERVTRNQPKQRKSRTVPPRSAPPEALAAPAEQGFNRRPTVIVAMDEEKKPPPPRPRMNRRKALPTQTPERPQRPGLAGKLAGLRGKLMSREKLVFVAVAVVAAIGTALGTRWIMGGEDDKPTETVAASMGSPSGQAGVVTPLPSPAVADKALLKIDSRPASGAQVSVDDTVLLEGTPAKVAVPPDRPVKIKVSLGEAYEPWESTVTLRAGEERTVTAQLKERQGTLDVTSVPIGASVFVDDRPLGNTPVTEPGLSLQRPVRLKVTKPGFKPHEQIVEWKDRREARVVVNLEPLEADPRPIAEQRPPPRRNTRRSSRRSARRSGRSARSSGRRSAGRRDPPVRRDPPAARGGEGFLSVQSQPWGSVFVDGNQVAFETPLVKYKLPGGRYRVYVCYGGDKSNKSRVRLVDITDGKHTRVSF